MTDFDDVGWGRMRWIATPESNGVTSLCACEVLMNPGDGHHAHVHPAQEEMIYVIRGSVKQDVGGEIRVLESGDQVVVPRGSVHSSVNIGDEPAHVLVVLSPAVDAPNGYEAVDAEER